MLRKLAARRRPFPAIQSLEQTQDVPGNVASPACSVKGIPSIGRNITRFPQAAIEGLSLARSDFVALVQDLSRELKEKQELFELE